MGRLDSDASRINTDFSTQMHTEHRYNKNDQFSIFKQFSMIKFSRTTTSPCSYLKIVNCELEI